MNTNAQFTAQQHIAHMHNLRLYAKVLCILIVIFK